MPMFLSDEQEMLMNIARPFMAEQAPPSHLRGLRNADDGTGFSADLWRRFAEMGLTGVLVAEAHGGSGLGAVEAGIVLEEIGRNLTPSPFLSTAIGAATALRYGSEAQRTAWLPRIAAGETVIALAIDEGPHHRPARTMLSAERDGNGFRLTGTKSFVQHGHVADLLIVAARTSGEAGETQGITLFAVERDAAGVSADPERLVDSSLASRVTFDGVTIDSDAVIGEVDGGWGPLSHLLDMVRTGAAAEMVGVASASLDMTLGYLRDRKQFGVEVGSFQALQHRAAHLYSELEVARAATLKAQQLLDAGDDGAESAAGVAKAMAGIAASLAVREGVQMHGGIGMTDEHDIGLYMKRERVLANMFGDADFHADRLAQIAGY